MSQKTTVLITGAAGEMGHSLISHFSAQPDVEVVAMDLNDSPGLRRDLAGSAAIEFVRGDILDRGQLSSLASRYQFDVVFHLAALLSTSGERNPQRAHEVNVEGSINVLNLARTQMEQRSKEGKTGRPPLKFIFPSTIAVYGISSPSDKLKHPRVSEDQFLTPITMYGVNKLYVEHLGRYFSRQYGFIDELVPGTTPRIDFRAIRFPGLVSAETVPTGGTSDYGAEMLHSAAQGNSYDCFVTPDARLPFMMMPDAIRALLLLGEAPRSVLSRTVYNVGAFSISAEEIRQEVLAHFPSATIGYKLHPTRNSIVSSWPADIDDSAARADWGWKASYDRQRAFSEYLLPAVKARYSLQGTSLEQELKQPSKQVQEELRGPRIPRVANF